MTKIKFLVSLAVPGAALTMDASSDNSNNPTTEEGSSVVENPPQT